MILNKIYHTLIGYKSRPDYWSLSPLADYMRQVHNLPEKLGAGTSEEFRAWDKAAKAASPVGYWITEELLDNLQDIVMFIPDMYTNIRYKLRNIFIHQSHVIRTGLPLGGYTDADIRIEAGLFTTIIEYVESEMAHSYDSASDWYLDPRNDDEDKEINEPIEDRREAGLAHLDWEISLDDSPVQSQRAIEVKEIYLWIKDIRPTRPDPHDHKEWREYCDNRECIFDQPKSDEDRKLVRRLLKEVNDLERQQKNEDTEMLIRIIKVRENLWT